MKHYYPKLIGAFCLYLLMQPATAQQLHNAGSLITSENTLSLQLSPLKILAPADTAICEGQGIWLQAFAGGGTAPYLFMWNGATDVGPRLFVQPSSTTTYLLTVRDANAEEVSRHVTVKVEPRPVARFDVRPDSLYLSEPEVQLVNQSTGAFMAYLNWGVKGASDIEVGSGHTVSYTFSEEGSYRVRLIAFADAGCRDTAYKEITVLKDFHVWIPTAFTPDNKGANETFYPYGDGIREYNMIVFNRWGQEVFRSRGPADAWTGCLYNNPSKAMEEGTYVYYIEVKNQHNRSFVYKGMVNLIR